MIKSESKMSFSGAEMPPIPFYTEQSLRSALAAIKKAVEDCLNQGNASARMAEVELQFVSFFLFYFKMG